MIQVDCFRDRRWRRVASSDGEIGIQKTTTKEMMNVEVGIKNPAGHHDDRHVPTSELPLAR
jgi:hypothetical protein